MHTGVFRFWITASLLAMVSACTTPPAGRPAPSPPVPASPGAAVTAPVSANAAPVPGPDVLPDPVAAVGDQALLAGEPPRAFEQGKASWYGPRFHGRRTASGERYNMHAFTAAHKTLPFGTVVRVRSMITGREVDVRITDRGPFSFGRVIDLSRAAAAELGMLGLGVKDVLLLVPESTAPVAQAPSARKPRRSVKPAPVTKTR